MYHTEENIFRDIMTHLALEGNVCSPRGSKIKELEDFSITLPPFVRFMNFEARKLSLPYIRREIRWYLRGDPFDTSIDKHAKIWSHIRSALGNVNSNYGQYIFAEKMINNVLATLAEDPDSRRASIMILNNQHLRDLDSKDVPCTYAVNFRIRDEYLNMSVHMRSQDIWFGMGNDIPAFSFLQELMAAIIGVSVGTYHHAVDSLHVYERNWESLEEIVNGSPWLGHVTVPRISGLREGHALMEKRPDIRNQFTKWLYQDHDVNDGEPFP